jgi:DNA-directed RNA polymerase delta subunit
MEKDDVRDVILETVAKTLEAQLKAVKKLRGLEEKRERVNRSMSQLDMAHDVLKRAKIPLHISEMIRRIESVHGVRLDRESLVSSLTKKVARSDRFIRTGKNTFALRESVE